MIVVLLLLVLVAFAAWKTLLWLFLNFDRVRAAGAWGVRWVLIAVYITAAVALPVWAYLHPTDDRAAWIWATYLVAPVLALVALWLLSARKRGVGQALRS